MAKESAIVPQTSNFVALAPVENLASDGMFSPEELRQSVGTAPPSLGDLQKIKMPAGGSLAWELLDENGEEVAEKSFDAVIVAAQDTRVYYEKKYSGGNEPPSCVSLDMVHGIPDDEAPESITRECATCPMNQWGSAIDEAGNPTAGKACKERKQMLLFRPHDLMPVLLSAPTSSVKSVQSYIRRLPSQGTLYWGVVTRFTLSKQKNKGGIVYSQIECSPVRALTEEEVKAVRALRAQFVPAIETHIDETPDDE